jgi:hypothetical protein
MEDFNSERLCKESIDQIKYQSIQRVPIICFVNSWVDENEAYKDSEKEWRDKAKFVRSS